MCECGNANRMGTADFADGRRFKSAQSEASVDSRYVRPNQTGLRVFLDTCVVNRIVEFREFMFDGYFHDETVDLYERRQSDQEDIDSLHNIVQVARRACLPLFFGETTLSEISKTSDPDKRYLLEDFAVQIAEHQAEFGVPDWRQRSQ